MAGIGRGCVIPSVRRQSEALSQRQFALGCGLARSYIGRLCAEGKIPTNKDKAIPLAEGLAALKALRGHATFDAPAPAKPGRRPAGAEAPAPKSSPTPPASKEPTAAELATQDREREAHAQVARVTLDIREQELATKKGRAALLELELQRARGELVPIAEVMADARTAGAVVRERLIALPGRLALVLEALCARQGGPPRATAIEAVLADEVNAVLDALHGTRFGERGA